MIAFIRSLFLPKRLIRDPQPFDRWIDPALISDYPDPRAAAKTRAELTALRDAATAKYGPLTDEEQWK